MEEPGRLQSMGSLELDRTERFHFHALEKEMATHSSVLAWRIPGMEERGGLPSKVSHRVGHDWRDLAAAAAAANYSPLCFHAKLFRINYFHFHSIYNNSPSRTGDIDIWVWSLGQKDSLEKGMAAHPSILAWRIPWTEEPGSLQFIGSERVGHY